MTDKRTVSNFINGANVDAKDGRRLDLIDPTSGEVFGTAPLSGRYACYDTYRTSDDRWIAVAAIEFSDDERAAAKIAATTSPDNPAGMCSVMKFGKT